MNIFPVAHHRLHPGRSETHTFCNAVLTSWLEGAGIDNFLAALMSRASHKELPGLSPKSSLCDWQSHWSELGILPQLMSASLPTSRGVWAVEESATPAPWSGGEVSVSEMPLHGLDLFVGLEKQIINSFAIGCESPCWEQHKRSRRSVVLRTRPALAIFRCLSEGLDAPLNAWAHVWHYLDTLRPMHEVVMGRIIPYRATRYLGAAALPCLRFAGDDTFGGDAAEVRYEVSLNVGNASSYRVLGDVLVSKRGDLLWFRSSRVCQNELPTDIVSILHGSQHYAVLLPQWCSLAIALSRVIKHERVACTQSPEPFDVDSWHLMGLRIRRCIPDADNGSVGPVAPCPTQLSPIEHLDTVAPRHDPLSLSDGLRRFRIPGVYPDAWHTSRGNDELLIRRMAVGEFVLTRWLHATASGIGLYDPKRVVSLNASGEAGAGSDVAALSDQIYTALLPESSSTVEGTTSRYLLAYAASGALVDPLGASRYRIALLSLFLEEASYLRRRAVSVLPGMSSCAGASISVPTNMRIKLGADRRSLVLVRRVVGVLRRLGLGQHDMTLWVRQVMFDLASGFTFDLGTRYQLIRSKGQRYQMKTLPYWHAPLHSQAGMDEVERLFGGSIQVEEGLGTSLVRNPKYLVLLGKHIGIQHHVLSAALAESYDHLARNATRYIESLQCLATTLGANLDLDGSQIHEISRSISRMTAVVELQCCSWPNRPNVHSVELPTSDKRKHHE